MANPDVTLKIHHIDGDMSAPWEYYDTFMKCEVGTPMMVNSIAANAPATFLYKLAALDAIDEAVSETIGVLISMGEYADGLSFEEVASGDEGTVAAALSKTKPMPMVYIRNDMVLESVSYDYAHMPGKHVVMNVAGEETSWLSWRSKDTDASDKLPTFLVIDAQPMVEGQGLPQKLLLRYIG